MQNTPSATTSLPQSLDWRETSMQGTSETVGLAAAGIALAGALYPLIATAIAAAVAAFRLLQGLSVGPIGSVLFNLLASVCASIVVGPIVGLLGFMFAAVLIPPVNAALGFALTARTQLALVGGLAGFLPFGWLCLFNEFPVYPQHWLIFLSLTGLAMLVGQTCSIWSGKREARLSKQRRNPIRLGRYNKSQFGLARMFAITFVVALFLAVDRIASSRLTPTFGIYAALQLVAWGADRLILAVTSTWIPANHES